MTDLTHAGPTSVDRPSWHVRHRRLLGLSGAGGAPRRVRDALAWSALAAYAGFLVALLA